MFYYLDPDDGYSKGPYGLDELAQLPLPDSIYIYDQERNEWHVLREFRRVVAARAYGGRPVVRKQPATEVREPVTATPARKRETQREPPPRHLPKPARPEANDIPDANPMGISGKGCFIVALLVAALLIGVVITMIL